MTTLAPKLPWLHQFSGGYPRVGGQPLPTDPDAIDYLERVKAADGGAGVEVGVAMAVDAFVRGCKSDGTWSALKASCILCGARTISGALVPLAGTAPTAYSFASGDYDRSSGLKGNGSTKYLDSNRANDADGQDDTHVSVYATSAGANENDMYIGSTGSGSQIKVYRSFADFDFRFSTGVDETRFAAGEATGFIGATRSDPDFYEYRISSSTTLADPAVSSARGTENLGVFAQIRDGDTPNLYASARLAFYSIGSSLDLAALDTRVSTLVAAIAAAI